MLLNGGLHKSKKTGNSRNSLANSAQLNSQHSMSSLTSASTLSSLTNSPGSPGDNSSTWSSLQEGAPTLSLDFETSRHSDLAPELLMEAAEISPRKVMKRNRSVYIFHGNESMDAVEAFNPFEECL